MATITNSPSAYFSKTQQLKQNVGDAGKLYESPIVQAPTTSSVKSTSTTPTSLPGSSLPKKSFSQKKFLQFTALGVFVLVLIGGGAGLYLSSQTQDTRQQASAPTGTGRIFVDPDEEVFTAGDTAEIELVYNMGEEIPINGLQIIAEITGDIPEDLEFTGADIDGLNLQVNNLTDIPNGKKLTVALLVEPPGPFLTPPSNMTLGTLSFTAPETGEFSIKFNPNDSKVIRSQTNEDVLKTPTQVATYTFGDATAANLTAPTPTPTVAVLSQLVATLSGTREIPVNSSTASGTVRVDFNDTTDTFSLTATISGIIKTGITGTHIHQGSLTQNGAVALDFGGASSWVQKGTTLELSLLDQILPASQSAELLSGNMYFNVHTTRYPNGEIRGQLLANNPGIGGGGTLPSSSPTPKPTPIIEDDTSSESARLASVPSTAQPQPVSGTAENTLGLIILGSIFFGSGLWLVKRQL